MVVQLVGAERLFEIAHVGCRVDNSDFHIGNLPEIFDMLGCYRVAEARVMGSTGVNPRGDRGFRSGLHFQNARATGSFSKGCGA